jgi:hypothetical protein
MKNFDHNIGFCEKTPFFRRKLSKIAENCDHNIDPRVGDFSPVLQLLTLGSLFENYRDIFAHFFPRIKVMYQF